jgi:hypothetical protein
MVCPNGKQRCIIQAGSRMSLTQSTNGIQLSRISEIEKLHAEIGVILRKAATESLPKAIRIGELLNSQKSDMPHGTFISWVEENLSIGKRQAQNYMKVFQRRNELSDYSGSFKEAIGLLAAPKTQPVAFLNEDTPLPTTTLPVFTATDERRVRKYIERDGLTETQARTIVLNDQKEREERKRKAEARKVKQTNTLKFTVRFTPELRDKAEQTAKQRGITIAELIRELLQ